ncbi:membrane fusion protein, cobalt-zinc-cadmium efflux system [Chitinophaga sp. CF118]|uniref:efflux RND transporter periplasmic adaptor subunit n=1 Tax=Chitinophaga sp. CF118 TaxID=1884367 RepID=UPI0008E70582|nr:efflux RND transporter periplasmic adaptor subunit [Chitinophaga sp. CF118]SFD76718.1 membrane fusion protein, cobalt-zinc-cadmium efflux system [Chitinophaga sp. CF118]
MKILLYSCLFLIIAGCSNTPKTESAAPNEEGASTTVELTPAQYKNAGVETGKIALKQISSNIKANGKLDVPPQSLITIAAPFGAFIKNTELLQGSPIRKGQVVATLQHPDLIQLQQDYLENRSQQEYLQADFEREEELAKENVNAKKVYQLAKAEYYSVNARVNGLREKLKLLNIDMKALDAGRIQNTISLYSPITGYVTEINTNVGAYVNPSDKLFEIVNTEHLHAELTVYERDLPKLKDGQRVRFTLANESKQRTAKVHLIGRQISDERTVQVHCHLDNEDKQLLPGMYLTAWIETGNAMVDALPDEAVIQFDEKPYIFIVKGKYKYEMVAIEKGSSELGFTEIILPQGFDKTNTEVVLKGAYALYSKMKNSEEEEE